MTSLALSLLSTYANYAKTRFVYKTHHMMAAQEQFLRTFLRHHQQTELGQTFGLNEIKTIDQFRDRIPVLPYSYYEPYVARIADGEKYVLNSDAVDYINLTSGSTGVNKKVPVTRQYQSSLRRAELASIGFGIEALQRRGLTFGKSLITNSIKVQGVTPGGIEYGPVSAGNVRKSRFLFEQVFSFPFDALQIGDSLARHYVCLLFALRNPNLRGMMANFPMLILRTCGYLERYAEELITDLDKGTIASWLLIEPEIRAKLERYCVPSSTRAKQLKEILKSEGRLTPKLAWTGLSYISTARGGTSDFYFERFPDYFDDTPVFGGIYGTAEGDFSVYPDFDTDGGILAIECGFFEFIPQDQWNEEHPKTLLPTEVKVGERYRILVTSYSGFYRYDIGDVVEVLGFYNQAPLIVFRHRRGGLLSSTTEKTTEFHVTQVMQQLQNELNLKLEDFCITLSDHEFPSPYLVNIELASGQILTHPEKFLERFDYWMGTFNQPYATVRQDQVPAPRLRILAPGSFSIVRQRQVERGAPDSQLKIPHLTEDRYFLKGLRVEQDVELFTNESISSVS
ncbi:MAG TPA: GH3 auxin-responsive promoter family protein [Cyanophyceae cyanobacterium]